MLAEAATRHAASAIGRQAAEAPPPTLASATTIPNVLRQFQWRTFAIRGGRTVRLMGVESVTWDDATAILNGTLTLRDLPFGAEKISLDEGDMVSLEFDPGGGFAELWRMRIQSPGVTMKERQRTFQLANDLDLLNRSDEDFYFKAGPKTDNPTGWKTSDVIREVCTLYGVRVGAIAEGTYVRKKSWSHRGYSPLRVIQEALNVERQHSGRRFVVSWKKQALYVTPLRRSEQLLELGRDLIEAELQSHLPRGEDSSGVPEGYFASKVTMMGLRNEPRAKDKQGRVATTAKRMQAVVTSPASVNRFGYVHRIVWSGDAKTEADLEEEGNQYLAAVAKPLKTVQMSLPGIPTLTRGDAIKLALGDDALRNQIVWITEASHNLDPSQYTTVITVTFDDPYVNKVSQKIQSRVSDTLVGAQKIANHLKPKKAKTRAAADAPATGAALPQQTRASIDKLTRLG